MEGIAVRPAKVKDLERTLKLFKSILQSPHYNSQAKGREAKRYSIKSLKLMLKNDPTSVLVATRKNDIIGFSFNFKYAGILHMVWIGVKKECRHQGVGESIMKAVVETAAKNGCHKILCDSRTENIPSKKFLTKNGFRKFAQMKKHWYKQDYSLWERFV